MFSPLLLFVFRCVLLNQTDSSHHLEIQLMPNYCISSECLPKKNSCNKLPVLIMAYSFLKSA